MDSYIGQKLDGRYEIQELIGEGGMANVYRGEDLLEHKIVAVKILREEYMTNEDLVRRFKNEGRAISVLNHPNIIKVFDVSVTDKIQFIVMEYVDGITLKEYIEQRGEPLTYKETVHFIPQVLLALQNAHDKGIVHRDIKPQNIMISGDGTIKIMDFGIARLARSEIHTEQQQAIGSVHYISPEQAQGAPTDMRADIYSTGIMMYEMLSGCLPFEGTKPEEIAIKQISCEAVPLNVVNPSVPEGLVAITKKAMEKDPKQRYQGALDMLRDMEEFKLNPSIKFEYDYMGDATPARYLEKMTGTPKRKTPVKTTGAAKPKRKRRMSIIVPAVAAITVVVVAICLLQIWSTFKKSSGVLFTEYDEVQLPNFVNMQISDVQSALKKGSLKNIKLMDIKEEYNPNYPPGAVISQNPSSENGDKLVKANQRLYLVVSKASEEKKIPDVAGMTRGEATKIIMAEGFMPYVVLQKHDTVPLGRVIGTDPAAGATALANPNTTITIFVSARSYQDYQQAVPDLIGLNKEDAANALREKGFELSPNIAEVYDAAEPGTIIEQTPEPGAMKNSGYIVRITVSKGAEPPPEPEKTHVPNVVGMTSSNAASALGAAGLNMAISNVSSSEPAGTVINQSPGNGAEVEKGTTVTVSVSDGSIVMVSVPSIIGVHKDAAGATLSSMGLGISVTGEEFNSQPAGTVLNQSPGGGTSVAKGTTISVTISKGPEPAPPTPPSSEVASGGG